MKRYEIPARAMERVPRVEVVFLAVILVPMPLLNSLIPLEDVYLPEVGAAVSVFPEGAIALNSRSSAY